MTITQAETVIHRSQLDEDTDLNQTPKSATPHHSRSTHNAVPLALRLLRVCVGGLDRLSSRAAGRWLYRLWFRTHRFPEPKREARWRAESEPSLLASTHGDIQLYSWGSGPAVLLMHGWSGRGLQMGAFVAGLLARGLRVVAFDAPGHGRSPGKQTTLFHMADSLRDVAREVGPVRGIVAHSFGAMVTVQALQDGLDAERVVMICPAAQMEFLVDSFCTALAVPAGARIDLRRRLEQRFGGDLWTRISAPTSTATLSQPALIVHDADDREVPVDQGELLARSWAGARLLRTEGLGHRRILRNPGTVDATVRFIVDEDTSPPSSPAEAQ